MPRSNVAKSTKNRASRRVPPGFRQHRDAFLEGVEQIGRPDHGVNNFVKDISAASQVRIRQRAKFQGRIPALENFRSDIPPTGQSKRCHKFPAVDYWISFLKGRSHYPTHPVLGEPPAAPQWKKFLLRFRLHER